MSRRAWLVSLSLVVGAVVAVVTLPRASLLLRSVRYGRARPLKMPVAGLHPREARSSWHAPRSSGRKHEGIDLFAKKGTPVVSATRGEVWRIGTDRLGGKVVTVLGDGPALYYYAHLDDWDDGLFVGRRVEKGTRLGFVGNTGNARTTPPHLHFGVYQVGWWRSRPVNPAPLLGVVR
jgi:murein DD-endopeptidase MepM/ murein hydrolase activator NlpD